MKCLHKALPSRVGSAWKKRQEDCKVMEDTKEIVTSRQQDRCSVRKVSDGAEGALVSAGIADIRTSASNLPTLTEELVTLQELQGRIWYFIGMAEEPSFLSWPGEKPCSQHLWCETTTVTTLTTETPSLKGSQALRCDSAIVAVSK